MARFSMCWLPKHAPSAKACLVLYCVYTFREFQKHVTSNHNLTLNSLLVQKAPWQSPVMVKNSLWKAVSFHHDPEGSDLGCF